MYVLKLKQYFLLKKLRPDQNRFPLHFNLHLIPSLQKKRIVIPDCIIDFTVN